MSDYGYYLNKDVINHYHQGHKRGMILGVLLGFGIGCAVAGFYSYQQFGPPSKMPDLSLLIGDMRRAKEDCEGIVYSVKSRWRAHIITDADTRVGASDYRDVASRFNGISATLEAMLSTGHDDQSVEEMRVRLSDAQRRYQAFRGWFDRLPREIPKIQPQAAQRPNGQIVIGDTQFEALPELAGQAIDLAKHFFDGMKEMDKLKREHLIGMIHDVRFKAWSEIPDNVTK